MSETIHFPVSEPIIRTGDIPALSKAVTKTCESVGEVARQNLILAEAVSALSERIAVLEGEVVVNDLDSRSWIIQADSTSWGRRDNHTSRHHLANTKVGVA